MASKLFWFLLLLSLKLILDLLLLVHKARMDSEASDNLRVGLHQLEQASKLLSGGRVDNDGLHSMLKGMSDDLGGLALRVVQEVSMAIHVIEALTLFCLHAYNYYRYYNYN